MRPTTSLKATSIPQAGTVWIDDEQVITVFGNCLNKSNEIGVLYMTNGQPELRVENLKTWNDKFKRFMI